MESVKTFKRNANFSGRDKFWEGEITEEDEARVGVGWRGQAALLSRQPHGEVLWDPLSGSLSALLRVGRGEDAAQRGKVRVRAGKAPWRRHCLN